MSFIAWIIIGGLAGWLASIVMKTDKKQGWIMDIIVGIIGSFLGGFVLGALDIGGGYSGFNLPSLGTAFVGAVIFLGILRFVRPNKKRK